MSKFSTAYGMKKKMANGGKIDRNPHKKHYEEKKKENPVAALGSHVMSMDKEEKDSEPGHGLREERAEDQSNRDLGVHHKGGSSKKEHREKLSELKKMPKPKLAEGGSVLKKVWDYVDGGSAPKPPPKPTGQNNKGAQILGDSYKKTFGMAEGGEVMGQDDGSHQDDDHMMDMVGRAMIRHQQKYSEGGKVANGGEDELSHMADSKPNNFDVLAMDDDLAFSDTGDNSGDHLGDEQLDEDNDDVVSKVMRSRAKKDHLPKLR